MVIFLWLIFSCVKILSANYSNGGKPLVLIPFMIKVSCYHTSNITLRVHYLSAPLALWLLATISSWSVYCLFLLANRNCRRLHLPGGPHHQVCCQSSRIVFNITFSALCEYIFLFTPSTHRFLRSSIFNICHQDSGR